ncbi:MAG: DUF4238 domain-containing protein [Candidatus Acidiferrales bacterium]
MANRRKNRRDHYLPQSYLRGFIEPSRNVLARPLWHFDVPNATWSERSPREISYRFGFYDHAGDPVGVKTADETFASLEQTFPRVRAQLIEDNFENWTDFRDFLLCYLQMMRARSLSFIADVRKAGASLRGLVIKEVLPDGRSVKVDSLTPSPLPADFITNWTIGQMTEEIHKGSGWAAEFNWALRYTDSAEDPFIVGDGPIVFRTPSPTIAEGMHHLETLLFFPLCWQACLIGSRQFFEIETDRFVHEDMYQVRRIYKETAELFLVSPQRLKDF